MVGKELLYQLLLQAFMGDPKRAGANGRLPREVKERPFLIYSNAHPNPLKTTEWRIHVLQCLLIYLGNFFASPLPLPEHPSSTGTTIGPSIPTYN